MEFLLEPATWLAFITLTIMEIVLGIDNIVFISILVGRLPKDQQARARVIGLALAMLTRIGLLFSLTWLMQLTFPLMTVFEQALSGRDLVLLLGGLFLMYKATTEIHTALEGIHTDKQATKAAVFISVVVQIAIIDIVFSLDSVITAVGLAEHIEVMVAAIVLAVIVMMLSAQTISEFIDQHPTMKMLALSFLILIGVALVAESLDLHISKGYIYFAMAFSITVEILNMRVRKRHEPVNLHKAITEDQTP